MRFFPSKNSRENYVVSSYVRRYRRKHSDGSAYMRRSLLELLVYRTLDYFSRLDVCDKIKDKTGVMLPELADEEGYGGCSG